MPAMSDQHITATDRRERPPVDRFRSWRSAVRGIVGRGVMVTGLTTAVFLVGCGGGDSNADLDGTWVHSEEGTLMFDDDGTGSLTQSSDPVGLQWTAADDTIDITWENGNQSKATIAGDMLTFRAGDFSGDDPVTFERQG